MAKTFRYQHLRSTQSGTKPSASVIREGEIAVNLATDNEKIFLKNANNQIVDFIPEAQINSKINSLSGTVDTKLAQKANVATTLAGYNIGDAYTKSEVDGLVSGASSDASALVNAEEERAISAETALDNKITAETSARQSADNTLQGSINQEVSDRKAEAVASAEYNSTTKKIVFKNKNGASLNTDIDCTAFIKDGMVSNVEIKTVDGVKCLVITFNSDSGKQDINIPLTDIFNPSNYYTKDEIDSEISAITSDVSAEEERAISAETALQNAIDYEEARAISAETALGTRIDNEISARTSADNTLQANIDNKQDTLVSGTNIKTVVSKSVLGSGNVEISLTDLSTSNVKDFTVDGDFIILDAGTY